MAHPDAVLVRLPSYLFARIRHLLTHTQPLLSRIDASRAAPEALADALARVQEELVKAGATETTPPSQPSRANLLRAMRRIILDVGAGVDHPTPSSPPSRVLTRAQPCIDTALWCLRHQCLDVADIFVLLGDLLDVQADEGLEDVWNRGILQWSDVVFATFRATKVTYRRHWLRAVNGLILRLSPHHDGFPVLRGRILLLVASLFPIDERSGLNIAGTLHETPDLGGGGGGGGAHRGDDDVNHVDASAGAKDDATARYHALLSVLDACRHPKQLLQTEKWKSFAKEVTRLVGTDGVAPHVDARTTAPSLASRVLDAGYAEDFIATLHQPPTAGTKAMELLLADPLLILYVLVQVTITLDYLSRDIECVPDKARGNVSMAADQLPSVRALAARVRTAAAARGVALHESDTLRLPELLLDEAHWVAWKNSKSPRACPPLTRAPVDTSASPLKTTGPRDTAFRVKTRHFTIPPAEHQLGGGRLVMGNAELARLWSLPGTNTSVLRAARKIAPKSEKLVETLAMERARRQSGDGVSQPSREERLALWRVLRRLVTDDFGAYSKSAGKADALLPELKRPREALPPDAAPPATKRARIS